MASFLQSDSSRLFRKLLRMFSNASASLGTQPEDVPYARTVVKVRILTNNYSENSLPSSICFLCDVSESVSYHLITLNVNKSAIPKRKNSPTRKIMSAMRSYRSPLFVLLLIAKKESMLLAIKSIIATAVSSSIIVLSPCFRIFRDVSTIKQRPNKLEDALST